jgi:cobalt/nickel transport system permease protein
LEKRNEKIKTAVHIPDNFLSTPVWASLDGVALPAVVYVSRKSQQSTEANRLPLLGVMGAFVFAAQMINFPVGLGTSGHLVGGTLLACVLGPWAGALVITAILIIQALVFQDGGVLALGANIFNMALMGVLFGYLPARALFHSRWRSYGVFLGGTLSVLVSGVLALSELTLSGVHLTFSLVQISLLLFGVNALLEGAITLSVLRGIQRLTPNALSLNNASQSRQPLRLIMAIAAGSIVLAMAGVLVASTLPDGLEQLAKHFGISFRHLLFKSPVADYHVQALGSGWLSRSAAGLIGLVLIYAVCSLGSHLVGRLRRSYS